MPRSLGGYDPRMLRRLLRDPVIVGGVIAVSFVGLAVLWHKQVREQVFPKNFAVVEDGELYRSGGLTPTMLRAVIRDYEIKTVIDFGGYKPGSLHERTARHIADSTGVQRYSLRLLGDGTGDPNNYAAALTLIQDPSNHPVLVHCAAGAQRTGACVALYWKVLRGEKLQVGLPASKERGHDPNDNPRMWPYVADWWPKIEKSVHAGGPASGYWIEYEGRRESSLEIIRTELEQGNGAGADMIVFD